jgi:ribosomal protein L37AE/L43A
MSKSQVTKSSSTVTACPECDSGNLVQSGSEIECISCGWTHKAVAKPTRTTKAPAKATGKPAKPSEAPSPAQALPSIAAQLTAAVTQAPKAKPEKAERTAPELTLVIAKQFKPRTNQLVDRKADGKGNFAQEANWNALVAAIQAHGGAITYAEAVQAVADAAKAGGYEKTANARGFVQGRVRGKHLTVAKAA